MPGGWEIWHDDAVDYLLAEVNIARMLAPLDSPPLADFVGALEHFPPPDVPGNGPAAQPGRVDLSRLRPARTNLIR
jgi:hypothetical protein